MTGRPDLIFVIDSDWDDADVERCHDLWTTAYPDMSAVFCRGMGQVVYQLIGDGSDYQPLPMLEGQAVADYLATLPRKVPEVEP